jgi:hypothetical protein
MKFNASPERINLGRDFRIELIGNLGVELAHCRERGLRGCEPCLARNHLEKRRADDKDDNVAGVFGAER